MTRPSPQSFIRAHEGILCVLLDLLFCLIAVSLAAVYGQGFGVLLACCVFGAYHLLRLVIYACCGKFGGRRWAAALYVAVIVGPLAYSSFATDKLAHILMWLSILLAVAMFLRDTTRPDYPDEMHLD